MCISFKAIYTAGCKTAENAVRWRSLLLRPARGWRKRHLTANGIKYQYLQSKAPPAAPLVGAIFFFADLDASCSMAGDDCGSLTLLLLLSLLAFPAVVVGAEAGTSGLSPMALKVPGPETGRKSKFTQKIL